MIPHHPPPPWNPHPADDLLIVRNIARLDHAIQADQGNRPTFTLELPKVWHAQIHEDCAHVPVSHYVGHYRGEPLIYLENNVHFGAGAYTGAPAGEVGARLTALETAIQRTLATYDALIVSPDDATKSRLNKIIDELTKHYAGWIRIHPFVDGNGRTARVLVNWLLARYWQPLILPGRPPSDRDALLAATGPALPASGADYRPLATHLRKRLIAARAAAAPAVTPASAAQAPVGGVAGFAGPPAATHDVPPMT